MPSAEFLMTIAQVLPLVMLVLVVEMVRVDLGEVSRRYRLTRNILQGINFGLLIFIEAAVLYALANINPEVSPIATWPLILAVCISLLSTAFAVAIGKAAAGHRKRLADLESKASEAQTRPKPGASVTAVVAVCALLGAIFLTQRSRIR